MAEPLELDIKFNLLDVDKMKRTIENMNPFSGGEGSSGGGGSRSKKSSGLFDGLLKGFVKSLGPFAAIIGLIKSSITLQKSMDALLKTLALLLKPVTDVIALGLSQFIRLILPLVKAINQIWAPFQKRIMESLSKNAEGGLLGAINVFGTIQSEFNNFIVTLFLGVIKELGGIIIDTLGDVTKAWITGLGLLVNFVASFLGKDVHEAVSAAFGGIIGAVDLGFGTAKLIFETSMDSIVAAISNISQTATDAQTTLPSFNDILAGIVSKFDPTFGASLEAAFGASAAGLAKLKGIISGEEGGTGVTDTVANFSLTLFNTMGEIFQASLDAQASLGSEEGGLTKSIYDFADAAKKVASDLINKAQELANSIVSNAQKSVSGGSGGGGAKTGYIPTLTPFGGIPIKVKDFIMRPGSPPVSIDPNDTLVGTKNGSGSGVNITINVSSLGDRQTAEAVRKAVEDVFRQSHLSGYTVR